MQAAPPEKQEEVQGSTRVPSVEGALGGRASVHSVGQAVATHLLLWWPRRPMLLVLHATSVLLSLLLAPDQLAMPGVSGQSHQHAFSTSQPVLQFAPKLLAF